MEKPSNDQLIKVGKMVFAGMLYESRPYPIGSIAYNGKFDFVVHAMPNVFEVFADVMTEIVYG